MDNHQIHKMVTKNLPSFSKKSMEQQQNLAIKPKARPLRQSTFTCVELYSGVGKGGPGVMSQNVGGGGAKCVPPNIRVMGLKIRHFFFLMFY